MKNRWKAFYKKHPYLSNLVVAIVCFFVLLLVLNISLSIFTRHGQSSAVPDFTDISLAEAQALAEENHMELLVTDSVFVNARPHGTVFRQTPAPGALVKRGRHIFVVINSLSPRMLEMPNVVGYSLRQAKTVLVSAGLHVGELLYVDDMATNNVLNQIYKGQKIEPGAEIPAESEVSLTVGRSSFSEGTAVPLLLGYDVLGVKDILAESSLNIGSIHYDNTVKTYSDTLTARVFKQLPGIAEKNILPLGYRINVWLTMDEEKIKQ